MIIINYYNKIKEELINNEVYKRAKDYSKNRSDLTTYYNVGKLLSEAGKHYVELLVLKNYKEIDIYTKSYQSLKRENTLYENKIKVLEFNNNRLNKRNIELTNK